MASKIPVTPSESGYPIDSSERITVVAVARERNPRGPGVVPTPPKPRKFASMTTDRAAGNESTGTDPDREQIETIEVPKEEHNRQQERILALEETVGDQKQRNDALEAEVEDLKESTAEDLIEVRSTDGDPCLEDVWVAGQPLGKIVESNRRTAKDAEKQAREARSSAAEPQGNDPENDSDDGLLPIERLLRGDDRDDWHIGNATPSVERAKELYQHFTDWASTTPKGKVLKTSGGTRGSSTLKNLLNAALDGPDLSWKQVYRCCHKLEEWTQGCIRFEDNGRHGKILVMEERPSSVANG